MRICVARGLFIVAVAGACPACDDSKVKVVDASLVDSARDAVSFQDSSPDALRRPDAGLGDVGAALCDASPPPRDAGVFDDAGYRAPESCVRGVIPTGVSLRWRNLNHRVSRWGFGVSEAPAADYKCASEWEGATADFDFVGGTFTSGVAGVDPAYLRLEYTAVGARTPATPATESSAPLFLYGETTIDIGPEQTATRQIDVDLSMTPLQGAAAVEVILGGLFLTTDVPQSDDYPEDYDPAAGYTSRGIGVTLSIPAHEADHVTFDATVRFAHGPAERADMNAAIPFAQTRARVKYIVVGLPREPLRATVAYEQRTRINTFGSFAEACQPQEALTEFSIDGEPATQGTAGLRSFVFNLFDGEEGGDYIREYAVSLAGVQYDPKSGDATGRLIGYMSNATPFVILHGATYTFEGEVSLLQWDSPIAVREGEVSLYAAVGESHVSLDVLPE